MALDVLSLTALVKKPTSNGGVQSVEFQVGRVVKS
jgi:hypothetical protein